ncbi:hypothetical protein [Nonomuraea sp. NPDC002799]
MFLADSRMINKERYPVNVSVRIPQVDDLIDQARAELDPARRAELWTQVERQVAEQAVLAPLAWESPLLLRGRQATNVHVSPLLGTYDLLSMGVAQ